MELFHANKQWSTRPADQRFTSLEALHAACKGYAATARERADVDVKTLRVENVDGDVQLIGRGNVPARLTHWSFGQLASRVGAPASYLRELPATLAAQNLNHGLARRVEDAEGGTVNLLFHENGSLLLRALTSDRYMRIWNHEITSRLGDLQEQGWEPARADIRIKAADDLPLYASDHDMFAFLRHQNKTVAEGSGNVLYKGILVSNSEVGASKLRLTRFLYREMCGNHIIWGAEDVIDLALRHVGTIRQQLQRWNVEIVQYLNSSVRDQEAQIAKAQRTTIAATKDQVLDLLFKRKLAGITRAQLTAGYDAVREDQDGDARTVWGLVQGLTRHSQTIAYADERTSLDRAAGKLISMAESF